MLSETENRAGLLYEFSRRMRHQLGMRRIHDEGCKIGAGCVTERLISCALADSWSTLSGLGYSREANDIMHEDDDDNIQRSNN